MFFSDLTIPKRFLEAATVGVPESLFYYKRDWPKYFSVNFAEFLRTPFL